MQRILYLTCLAGDLITLTRCAVQKGVREHCALLLGMYIFLINTRVIEADVNVSECTAVICGRSDGVKRPGRVGPRAAIDKSIIYGTTHVFI
jgi:hypothetical protein